MGNANSCSCICIPNGAILKKIRKGTKTAMLLDSDENPREIKLPATSGELMIQEFGHVITPVDELRRTGRVSALLADEELVAGKVYLLLPVNRVNSKASEFEMALAEKQSGHTKRTRGNNMAKVSPSVCPRFGNQVRWNPVLDPIFE
ncbi:hypothetical protein GLYMA_19G215700v4 [Glycine max]|uniref:DUF4228 domain-containing protein n=1 Tax=Glycine max TaxID=3847 RepID=I1NBB7_SOYBN|nr:uncharacterized protein LOC100810032 [Glycine max]XP_028217331.1 uncharacterized protein LOC114399349 [Glycine soja]KAG4913741.1 hypothetical protein JHK86_054174 [Glycine max]KAG4928647.1 hypothetical protein JHK85_055133 [Glycine max]KAG5084160.1 hypothetical protein JHK84_054198 [Glycine max]KAH1078971.1 hypothetical protein GYH30_053823 [Glycine max]KHN43466.1 hypothetical protein glysoja_002049 [Glycine soja]|eukprot:XP_003554545.1 uncharacterized protein LOC100810032 [Glycine max]